MDDSPESKHSPSNDPEECLRPSIEIQPLAYTIQFDDQKVDGSRKLKIHERLSAFALKHRRNPSLPDFGAVKNAKTLPPEKLPSPISSQNVPRLVKSIDAQNVGCQSEGYFSGDQENGGMKFKSNKYSERLSPAEERSSVLPKVNGVLERVPKKFKNIRRSSLNDIEAQRLSCQETMPINVDFKLLKNGCLKDDVESENKSDTVSEAGTYTVDKDESPVNELELTHNIEQNLESEEEVETAEAVEAAKDNTNFHHKWINDWVNKVAEQNLLYPSTVTDPVISKNSGSGSSSPGGSKIPSPINTLPNRLKTKPRPGNEKPVVSKLNGSLHHKRSSSLNAKVSVCFDVSCVSQALIILIKFVIVVGLCRKQR